MHDLQALNGATIAFDLDGTLVDTAPDLVGALNMILAEEGLPPLPFDEVRLMVGRGARALLERGFAAAGHPLDALTAPKLVERFIAIYLDRIAQESAPFPGVVEVLATLRQAGAKLVVCTNKLTNLSVALLDALKLSTAFDAVVGADLSPAAKPDPIHVLTAIKAVGGDPRRAVMVGDSINDALAASPRQRSGPAGQLRLHRGAGRDPGRRSGHPQLFRRAPGLYRPSGLLPPAKHRAIGPSLSRIGLPAQRERFF
jgi:phosphoglycolate phosphatase